MESIFGSGCIKLAGNGLLFELLFNTFYFMKAIQEIMIRSVRLLPAQLTATSLFERGLDVGVDRSLPGHLGMY